jgi:2,3-bisphosphoglycerate-dependent phosphoglycerate mutase
VLIGLIRHGQTEWNALGRIQGQTDIPLSEEGRRQAEALANRLVHEEQKWDAVISSSLQRAHETARIIANALALPLLAPDERLNERYFGEVEGTTVEERLGRWGENWRQADAGQESDAAVRARGMSFIQEWRTGRPETRLLVVSHGSFLAQLLQEMCGQLDDGHLVNMSFSILAYEERTGGGIWKPLLHNCSLHLQQTT